MPITTRSVHREEQLRLDKLKIAVPCDVWFEIAKQLDDFVQSYQMLCISSEAQIGIGNYLRQLPGLIVTGGWVQTTSVTIPYAPYMLSNEVWRLSLYPLAWVRMVDLAMPRAGHSSCVVQQDKVVSVGGRTVRFPDEHPFFSFTLWNTQGRPASGLMNHPCATHPGPDRASFEVMQYVNGIATTIKTDTPLEIYVFTDGAVLEVAGSGTTSQGSVELFGGLDREYLAYPTEPDMMIPMNPILQATNRVLHLDLASAVCTQQPPMPLARSGFAADTVQHGGGIVIAGGRQLVSRRTSSRLSAAGVWGPLTEMNTMRLNPIAHSMDNDDFLVIGGVVSGVNHNTFLSLDLTNNEWVTREFESHNGPQRFYAASAKIGSCIIVAGGITQLPDAATGLVEVFRTQDHKCRTLPCALPRPLFAMGCVTL